MADLNKNFEAAVLYTPLKEKGEIDYRENFIIEIPDQNIVVPYGKESDPFEWAEKVKKELEGKKVIILIPGRKFDTYGTRIGNGGGWYDRFLSKIPREWLRIGVCNAKEFRREKLERKEWDEPVDWIIVKSPQKLSCIKALESHSDDV